MALPRLTPEQRDHALAQAQAARLARVALYEKLRTRAITLEQVFEMAETDPVIAKTRIVSVLKALPGVGPATARKWMDKASIADTRRVRGVGEAQRRTLLELVAVGFPTVHIG